MGRVSSFSPARPVHPRARGEHVFGSAVFGSDVGSSPRTRGTYSWGAIGAPCSRFIPAHAGNISWPYRWSRGRPVHPRARGEHFILIRHTIFPFGSSPRTRGTYQAFGPLCRVRRFIPAHAGNIVPLRSGWRTAAVHPRARGEHFSISDSISENFGSSPRTRGTWYPSTEGIVGARFIPAHAGNIHDQSIETQRTSVHPRARGEHEGQPARPSGPGGSSPRTRGTYVFEDFRS